MAILASGNLKGWEMVTAMSGVITCVGAFILAKQFGFQRVIIPAAVVEVFAAGRVLQLDNFRKLICFGWPGFKKRDRWQHKKGQKVCAKTFHGAIKGRGPLPTTFDEVVDVSRASINFEEMVT
jgi:hypothetical protein